MIARLFSVSAWPVGSAGTALTVAGSFARAHEFLHAIFSGTTDRNVGLPPIVVAHASGRREEALTNEAIRKAHARSRGRPVPWRSDSRRPT